MATKNLARTVIEGGRHRYNKWERRYSNRKARARSRQFADRLRFDDEAREGKVAPKRQKVHRSHSDRLGAARRWLASHVGRPWSKVRSEIAQRFDTRTIAGQHIVFDHLLPSVRGGGSSRGSHWWHEFAVDHRGILVALPRRRWQSSRKLPKGKVRRSCREISAWAQGR